MNNSVPCCTSCNVTLPATPSVDEKKRKFCSDNCKKDLRAAENLVRTKAFRSQYTGRPLRSLDPSGLIHVFKTHRRAAMAAAA